MDDLLPMKNRLKRIGGQIQEILRMTDQEADCRHSVMSMTAVDRVPGRTAGKNLD
ncbi:metal-sensing transcriptional repressor [Sporolactobacillus sp. CQH2019]|uniref:metal-sensing transcriptional repressor n=1 Tax=Sporolactobacillus sp. CQH2019 TaxID=3023512 RepID=UPI002368495F|nr:metal-sensing transcriptional repressor [Sporolactobacillus sp. CQH2019]MDD9149120.1 metal-sensing transcriptional repressor [Sporolactobacillus sp. CQH2019]